MSQTVDVAVIGGGILGLAFAWESARRGRSVVLFERDRLAQGGSIRNFGMVWPIGQTPGAMYHTALRSRERWLELAAGGAVTASECGSLHLAREADEDAVLREFAGHAPTAGIQCQYLEAAEAVRRYPHLNAHGLRGVLFSPTELVVDPRQAIARIPKWLVDKHKVQTMFQTAITAIDGTSLVTATGDRWTARQVFVASGVDFETLFPAEYRSAGLKKCKLQMMRTPPQPGGWKLGPHIAGGLTLTHYKSFDVCNTLPALKKRVAETMPEYVKYGIHVMASQNELGEVVIGDSHEYDADISIFDSERIDSLILSYLKTLLNLPEATIAQRWHGLYAKHATQPFVTLAPQPGVTIVTAPGGAGMTLSFGLARNWWDAFEDGRPFTVG